MTVVDSSVWIDFINRRVTPQTEWLKSADRARNACLTDIILCEVLQGVRNKREALEVRFELAAFPVFDSGGAEQAIATAANYRFLRTQGRTVRKLADCLIATFCIENNHVLLHRDRDFDPFEQHLGLRVIHPQQQTVK